LREEEAIRFTAPGVASRIIGFLCDLLEIETSLQRRNPYRFRRHSLFLWIGFNFTEGDLFNGIL
jgi:hypothetical protein